MASGLFRLFLGLFAMPMNEDRIPVKRHRLQHAEIYSTVDKDDGTIIPGVTVTGRIEINPAVLQGKPVIRGTRIPVELLLRKLAEGATLEDLLDAYPRLTPDDVRACLAYAAETISHESVVTLTS